MSGASAVARFFVACLIAPLVRGARPQTKHALVSALLWGGLTATALPPLFVLPLGLVGLAAWFRLVDLAFLPRHAFFVGFGFAFGYFLGGLWWIALAFQHEVAWLVWASVPLVILLAGVLAVFWGVASYGARCAPQGVARLLFFSAGVLAVELVRGFLFGGFPWNPLASLWAFSAVTLQPLAVLGADLWGVITLLACATVAQLVFARPSGFLQRARLLVLLALVLVPLAVLIAGGVRVAVAPPPPAEWVAAVRLRIVQPQIDQQDKWSRATRRKNLALQEELLATPGNFTHAVLPEATVAWPLNTAATVRALLTTALAPEGRLIIGGITRLEPVEESAEQEGSAEAQPQLHNSLYFLDATGGDTCPL